MSIGITEREQEAGEQSDTSKRKAVVASYAGFFWRVPAFIVDTVVSLFVCGLLIVSSNAVWRSLAGEPLPISSAPLILFLVTWLYPALFESSRWKATIGKKLFGLRAVDQAGYRLGFGKATTRSLARILSWALCMLGFLAMLFGRKKQTLHDRIAGTLVLHVPESGLGAMVVRLLPAAVAPVLTRASVFFMALLSTLMLTTLIWAAVLVAKPHYLRAEAVAAIHLSIEQVEPIKKFISAERLVSGAYPKAINPEVLAKVTIGRSVAVRYFAERGVLDVSFAENPYLQGRTVSLIPVVSGEGLKWVCSAQDLDPAMLPLHCRNL